MSTTSASSPLYMARAPMRCSLSKYHSQMTVTPEAGRMNRVKPRRYCVSNLIGHEEGVSAWKNRTQTGIFLQEKRKLGYNFPSTKNRMDRRWTKIYIFGVAI